MFGLTIVRFLRHREEVKSVKFSWDGEYIAAAGDDRCIDIVSHRCSSPLPVSFTPLRQNLVTDVDCDRYNPASDPHKRHCCQSRVVACATYALLRCARSRFLDGMVLCTDVEGNGCHLIAKCVFCAACWPCVETSFESLIKGCSTAVTASLEQPPMRSRYIST
jgi:WD40 repeat protein